MPRRRIARGQTVLSIRRTGHSSGPQFGEPLVAGAGEAIVSEGDVQEALAEGAVRQLEHGDVVNGPHGRAARRLVHQADFAEGIAARESAEAALLLAVQD